MAKKAQEAPENGGTEEAVVETPKVTAKALAAELGTNDRELRKFLRDVIGKENKPGGRWEWDEGDPQIDTIREAWAAKQASKAEEAAETAADDVDEEDDVEID